MGASPLSLLAAVPVADIVIPASDAFWFVAALLVLAALGFVLLPLLLRRSGSPAVVNRRAMMRALYRDRLGELESEAAAGQVDADTRGQVMEELSANLLEEYRVAEAAAAHGPEEAGGRPARRSPITTWVLALLLPAAAFGVYLSVGEPRALDLVGASEVLRLDPNTDQTRIEYWRERLAKRVASRPEDGQSWFLLGVSRLELGQYAPAADAFAKAHRYLGSDPNLSLYWLQARYLASGGKLDKTSRTLAQEVLSASPDNPLVLEMFAIDAFHRGDFRTAVTQINRALSHPMPDAERASLMEGLKQARSHMGILTPTIDVSVDAPSNAPKDGTLFVIARPPGGGMPYAVVRRPVSMLPLSVRLDDTASMNGAKLSGADAVQVVVRLSRSGNAMAGPGDWEWHSAVLHPGDKSQPLTLSATLAPGSAETASIPGTAAPAGSAPAGSAAAIDVAVNAPPDAPRQGTIYVIARPPGGGMPYAVVRRPASALPLSVRLDDSASMSGVKLSSASSVQVVVRLSLSGRPLPEPGDWEWHSQVLHPGSESRPLSLNATLAPLSSGES